MSNAFVGDRHSILHSKLYNLAEVVEQGSHQNELLVNLVAERLHDTSGFLAELNHRTAVVDEISHGLAADDLGKKVVELITTTGEARERLSQQAYTTLEPTNPLGLLQEALELSENLAPLEKKLKQAKREGLIQADYFGHQIDEAEGAEVISAAETRELRTFHEKVLHLLSVDDFSPEELGRTGSNSASPTVPAADTVAVPRVQNSEPGSKAKKPAVEKAPGKKPAKRAAAKKSSRKKAASKKKNAKKK